jgi:hypothetical protein
MNNIGANGEPFDHTHFNKDFYEVQIEGLKDRLQMLQFDLKLHQEYLDTLWRGYVDYLAQGSPNN